METNDSDNKRLREAQAYWDQAAEYFDEAPDHGLRDPQLRQSWIDLLRKSIPVKKNGQVLDIGCGTGSLSLILSELGYQVTGIDLSPNMITIAKAKAEKASAAIHFEVMNAADPQFTADEFDLIICRHLLWALPEPKVVLQHWANLLKSSGCLMLIEGFWHTKTGLHASEVHEALCPLFARISIEDLSSQPDLWGGPVTDERYIILARDIIR